MQKKGCYRIIFDREFQEIDLQFWVQYFFVILIGITLLGVTIIGFWMLFVIWLKNRNREEVSMNFVLLEIAVPKDNEVKIDAVEQLFASIFSIKRSECFFYRIE